MHGFVLVALLIVAVSAAPLPNVIIFVADDLGYGDLSCFGNDSIQTPHLDKLARTGVRLTQAYVAAPVCTPSRAALMTGRYAIRSGMDNSGRSLRTLISTGQPAGLPPTEFTIVKALRNAGYHTKMIGKWHLGTLPPNTPISHEFHSYFGMPLTNVQTCGGKLLFDPAVEPNIHVFIWNRIKIGLQPILIGALVMAIVRFISWRSFAGICCLLAATHLLVVYYAATFTLMSPTNCILYRDDELIEQPVKLENLTVRFTNEAVRYVREQHSPFFLYMPFVKVHTALFTSPAFTNHSHAGAYGDNVEELDWSVGRVMQELDTMGIADNTIVVFTSDNGAWLEEGVEGGSSGPLRGGKGQNWEGGIRVPTIVRWPAKIPGGRVINAVSSLMDLLPTLLAVTEQEGTQPRPLDGRNLMPLLSGATDDSPHQILMHLCGENVAAVRIGKYKVHFETPIWTSGQACPELTVCPCQGTVHDPPLIFDMDADISESHPLDSTKHEAVIAEARRAAKEHLASVVLVPNQLTSISRPWLQPCCNWPRCECEETHSDDLPL